MINMCALLFRYLMVKGLHSCIISLGQPYFVNAVFKCILLESKNKNVKKCTVGFDSLSTKLIQQTIEEIVIPLGHIINPSFVTGVVPDNLEVVKVIPIYKRGNNYVL